MCVGIALPLADLPGELVTDYKLSRRVHERDGQEECRFLFRDFEPLLPVWDQGRLRLVKWGVLAVEGAIWRGFSPQEMALPVGILLAAGVVGFAVGARALSGSER